MIHWGWMVAAFYGGFLAAVFYLGLCRIGSDSDQRMNEIKGDDHD